MNRKPAFAAGIICILTLTASLYASSSFPGDDGIVDLDDFIALKLNFGCAGTGETGDVNEDGMVDLFDFVVLKRNYPSVSIDPTPCGAVLTAEAVQVEDLVLFVGDDGRASLLNTSASDVQFDGYHIKDSAGMLNTQAWYSLNDRLDDPSTWPVLWPDMNPVGFGELNPHSSSLAEVALSDLQTIHPGQSIDLGLIAPNGRETLSFLYSNSYASGSGVFESLVVPEPASMSLLALGGFALIHRRR